MKSIEHDPTEDPISAEQRELKEAEEKLNRAYYSTFHSAEGQVVLQDLMNSFYRRTSLSDDSNPNSTLINEGKRFVVISILTRMEMVSGKAED